MNKPEYTHCCYCRRKFSNTIPNLKKTKDHFYPISKGGHNGENKLDCCFECNQWKADKLPDFWLSQVEHFEKRRIKKGTYTLLDYRQIKGSLLHWRKHFKGKVISEYKL